MLLVTHDLEEAISLSDRVYLLSQGPRAHITQQYDGADPAAARSGQGARASGVRAALREAVERSLARGRRSIRGPRRRNDAHRSALRLAAPARGLRRPAGASGRRPAASSCSIRCSCRARARSAARSTSCSPTAASGRISKPPSPPRSVGLALGIVVGIVLGVIARADPAGRGTARAGDDAAQRHPARDPGAAVRDLARHRARVQGRALLHPGRGA